MKYEQDDICIAGNYKADEVNSRIMEQASDTAEELTQLRCLILDITCHIESPHGTCYTQKAQDIFNNYYDEQKEQLYSLVNDCLEIDSPEEKENRTWVDEGAVVKREYTDKKEVLKLIRKIIEGDESIMEIIVCHPNELSDDRVFEIGYNHYQIYEQ